MFDGVVTLDALGPYEVFQLAKDPSGQPAYDVVLAGPHSGPIRTESGLTLVADHALADLEPHTLVVPGSSMGDGAACLAPEVLKAVRTVAPMVTRMVGICTGAFALAHTGQLTNRRATTHWTRAEELQRAFPCIRVQPDAIFVHDGPVWTSAGVTAGIDLALALVEQDLGRPAALSIARELVVFLRRPGGQSQFSRYLSDPSPTDDRMARLRRWIADRLHEPLNIEQLAQYVAMSPRNFRRVFRQQLNTTPAQFVERCRVDAVAAALETSDETLDALAGRFGLGNAERLRRAFHRWLGVSPRDYRARFR